MRQRRFIPLAAVIVLLFSISAGLAEEPSAAETWICLMCGTESEGGACTRCGTVRGIWRCSGCGSRNLSGTCSSCGMAKDASLDLQAENEDLIRAFPAVRSLAHTGRGDALCRWPDTIPWGT